MTGRFRFKRGWFGRQILYVEVRQVWSRFGDTELVWKKATEVQAGVLMVSMGGRFR